VRLQLRETTSGQMIGARQPGGKSQGEAAGGEGQSGGRPARS
jgi:hypothetical protein